MLPFLEHVPVPVPLPVPVFGASLSPTALCPVPQAPDLGLGRIASLIHLTNSYRTRHAGQGTEYLLRPSFLFPADKYSVLRILHLAYMPMPYLISFYPTENWSSISRFTFFTCTPVTQPLQRISLFVTVISFSFPNRRFTRTSGF